MHQLSEDRRHAFQVLANDDVQRLAEAGLRLALDGHGDGGRDC